MPHPDDDRVTLTPEELQAAAKEFYGKLLEDFGKEVPQHVDDLNAMRTPTDENE